MNTAVRTRIVKVGNSRGIRIPKLLLEQSGVGEEEEVELTVESNQLVIRRVQCPRQGWDEAFARMAAQGDDRLLDAEEPLAPLARDEDEWQW